MMSKLHDITVTLGQGPPSVNPEKCRARPGDEIRWSISGSGRFRVDFEGGESPVGSRTLPHDQATRPNRVPEAVVRKQYRYSVAPESNPANALDPVIIIEDPTG